MLKGILLKIGLKRVCFKKLIEPPLFKSGLVKALKNFNFWKGFFTTNGTKRGKKTIASFGYFVKHDPTLIRL